jgi:hypothetical protein
MYAQSLVEYGALASIVAGIEHAAYTARTWIVTLSPRTWAIVGGVLLAVLILKRGRTSR